MRFLLTVTLALTFLAALAQDNQQTTAIVAEGKRLYRSEMASWYGTDIFLEKFKDQRDNIGGYFSYTEGDHTKCVFFSREEHPKVLATMAFDNTYQVWTAQVDGKQRDFSPAENDLYVIRQKALDVIQTDKLFKRYKNTNFNLIPLVSENERKVYVLTGTEESNLIVFGNDYLLTFNKDNNITDKKQLHQNFIPVSYAKQDQNVFGTMHTHLPETGDYITATDICTLMLYEKLARWKQHIVISANYISIWDCESNQLAVLPKEAWEKMQKDQKSKN